MKLMFDYLNERIREEQIRILYRQSKFVFLGIIFAGTVVVMFLWPHVSHMKLMIWMLLNTGLTGVRAFMASRFKDGSKSKEEVLRWGRRFGLFSTVSGLLWGSIALFFIQPDNIETVLLVSIVLAGMSAGSLVPLSAYLPACFGFTLSALVPLAIVMLNSQMEFMIFAGYLVIIFLFVNLGYAVVNNRNIAESVRLRYENIDLLKNLQHEKERAELANADKTRFLAATSHDLRQPLHALELYLGALRNTLTTKEQIELIDKSRESSHALNELLSALMDISRLDSAETDVNHSPVLVSRMFRAIVDEFSDQAEKRTIGIEIDSEDLVVKTDPVMLARILRNLVSNALSHSGASHIVLRSFSDKGIAHISVCDNGQGIPLDKQEAVFTEFTQLDNPERDRSKGLGLGLAIVRRLSLALKHELTLESRPGDGCCFHLEIPLSDASDPVEIPQASEDRAVQTGLIGLFVLVVDDEASVRDSMRTLLHQWGCEVLIVDGLDTLKEEFETSDYPMPDIVVTDYRLRHNTNGLDVVSAVNTQFNSCVPAVIISGDTDKEVQARVAEAGLGILYKPVEPEQLKSALKQCLLANAK